jgi:hypothetical protein
MDSQVEAAERQMQEARRAAKQAKREAKLRKRERKLRQRAETTAIANLEESAEGVDGDGDLFHNSADRIGACRILLEIGGRLR